MHAFWLRRGRVEKSMIHNVFVQLFVRVGWEMLCMLGVYIKFRLLWIRVHLFYRFVCTSFIANSRWFFAWIAFSGSHLQIVLSFCVSYHDRHPTVAGEVCIEYVCSVALNRMSIGISDTDFSVIRRHLLTCSRFRRVFDESFLESFVEFMHGLIKS